MKIKVKDQDELIDVTPPPDYVKIYPDIERLTPDWGIPLSSFLEINHVDADDQTIEESIRELRTR